MSTVKDEAVAAAFGALLRQLRTEAGLSQSQLGQRTEPPMQIQAVARYEAGDRAPTLTVVFRLAAALGVDPRDLIPETKKRRKK